MDAMNIFLIGATAITLLFFVMFVDKKCHIELMKELKPENKIIITNAQERVNKAEAINSNILKAENMK